MNLYCDNYSVCNEYLPDQGTVQANETRARAKGWHIWHGVTMGGSPHHGCLGPRCADNHRRRLSPSPPVLVGQQELIEIVVTVDPAA